MEEEFCTDELLRPPATTLMDLKSNAGETVDGADIVVGKPKGAKGVRSAGDETG